LPDLETTSSGLSWDNADEALREVDGFISRIEGEDMPGQMDLKLLFAPTGSIQEVAVSSGWGGEFLELAERFDAAMQSYDKAPYTPPHGNVS
jgi:hypothetical protein